MREFDIIQRYFKPLTNNCKAARNLEDDTAIISLKKDEELVVSSDTIVENIHFFANESGFNIAAKLLLSNLSDIAAAGATPNYYTLNFSKDEKFDENFIKDFARGLKSVQNNYGISLIGGDTVKSKQKFFSITIFGTVKKGKNLNRNKANIGDAIFVSGNIGDAFLGLLERKKSTKNSDLIKRFLAPTPRIELGEKLIAQGISNCAIDISDGLLADLQHICSASKVSAEIYFDKIPLSMSAEKYLRKNSKIKKIDLLSGGDDYELIFTVPQTKLKKVEKLEKDLQLKLTHIGNITAKAQKSKLTLLDENLKQIKIDKFGYEH